MTQSPARAPWVKVAIFYVIAVGLSAPFRLGWVNLSSQFPLPYGFNLFYKVFSAIGPIAGYFTLFYVLKSKVKRTVTLGGNNLAYSIGAFLVIPLCFCVLGVPNTLNLDRHYYGLLFGLMFGIYALFEEYGWRGYLQQALEPLQLPVRVLVIAVLWFVWHLNFLLPDMSVQGHLIHFLAIVLGSWGLMIVSQKTGSLLFVAALHLSFNLFTDVRGDFLNRLITLGIAITIWIVLLRRMTPQSL